MDFYIEASSSWESVFIAFRVFQRPAIGEGHGFLDLKHAAYEWIHNNHYTVQLSVLDLLIDIYRNSFD